MSNETQGNGVGPTNGTLAPELQTLATNSSDRDAIRAKIFGTQREQRKKVIDFFGAKVEVRQPSTMSMMSAQAEAQLGDADDGDAPQRATRAQFKAVCNYVYVPGTNELVFTSEDVDALLELPFDGDMVSLMTTVAEITNVSFTTSGTTSNGTRSATQ